MTALRDTSERVTEAATNQTPKNAIPNAAHWDALLRGHVRVNVNVPFPSAGDQPCFAAGSAGFGSAAGFARWLRRAPPPPGAEGDQTGLNCGSSW